MSFVDAARDTMRSPAFKFLIVLALILALTIPLLFVYALVWEREQFAKKAATGISQTWANRQTVSGPYLIVPTETSRQVTTKSGSETRITRGRVAFLPEVLKVTGDIQTEIRSRGIFDVPVYRSQVGISGRFLPPDWQRVAANVDRLLWAEAELVVLISDVRGIKSTASISIGGSDRKFRAGSGLSGGGTAGIHVPVSEATVKAGFPFAFDLALNGSKGLSFVPAGGETDVKIKSNWPHPSFGGQFLPDARDIADTGFSANWKIPRLARGQGQELALNSLSQLRQFQSFGVELFQPVRFYSLAQRALKYALGFIAIAFLAVFVIEIQSRQRVHWIQYLFAGLALIIFYVLLVGTAEHIGFDAGYGLAAFATTTLIGTYFGTVTRSARRGAIVFGVLALIYGLLFLLLRLEDYALLVGSIAAFSLIAIVMFATRNVDWSGKAPGPDAASAHRPSPAE